jgi:hypothetical protein
MSRDKWWRETGLASRAGSGVDAAAAVPREARPSASSLHERERPLPVVNSGIAGIH